MKTLSAALEAAQKSNSGLPYIEALVDDYWGYGARARPQELYAGAEPDDPAAAGIAPDGSLIRLRRLTQAATIERAVAASADDAWENNGTPVTTATGVNTDDTDEYVGARFLEITIPQGATILLARFLVAPQGSGNDPVGTLYGEDADNSAAFTTGANNLSGRAATTATVAIDETGLPDDGLTYVDLAEVTAIVQEIVDRGGWASGNAMSLIYQGASAGRAYDVVQWDGDPSHAARLEITYATGSPQATAYASRVTTPAPGDTFSPWTELDDEISALGDVCLAVDSDTLYAFMVDDDLTTIVMRRSTNNGASWTSRSTVTSAGGVKTKLAAAAADDGDIVLFYADQDDGLVYTIRMPSGGEWGSPAAWTNSLEVIDGLACCYVADWQVIVTGREDDTLDPGVWSCYFGDGGQFTINTWGPLRDVVTSAHGSEILYTEPSVARADVFRLYFTERFAGDEAYAKIHWTTLDDSKSFNEDQWREPQVFNYEGDGVAVTVSGAELWLAASNGVWLIDLPAFEQVDIAAAIVEVSVRVDDAGAIVDVELDNADGTWTAYGTGGLGALQRGARLQLTPGYATPDGDETPGGFANTYWVESLELVTGARPVLKIRARDGWWLLSRWRARRQFGWVAGDLAVSQLLMRLVGRGGMGYTGGGTVSALLTTLQPAFTVQPGETGEGAVRRLLRFVEDVGYWAAEFLNVRLPEDDESATYAFGPGEHAVLEARYPDVGAAVNRARVVGIPGIYAEETDFSESERVEQIGLALDLNLTTGEEAATHAAAMLRKSYLEAPVAEIKLSGVHCGVQLFDVIELTDPQAGLDAVARRVIGYTWRFDGQRGRYDMTLTLGNL